MLQLLEYRQHLAITLHGMCCCWGHLVTGRRGRPEWTGFQRWRWWWWSKVNAWALRHQRGCQAKINNGSEAVGRKGCSILTLNQFRNRGIALPFSGSLPVWVGGCGLVGTDGLSADSEHACSVNSHNWRTKSLFRAHITLYVCRRYMLMIIEAK